ncbi:hypothetical protein CK203_034419 [Vitis vinifera]|uniref:Uncharacterized protein n=1 Tax=Vitis vinifera TaxID=29760 RepID=A0A438HZH0_VITVI|nr:hypothetical protein CK203_034419 [Vitis vinifera]
MIATTGNLLNHLFGICLNELAEMSCRVPASDLSGSVQKHFSDRYGQTPKTSWQNIEMKRGDWLCPRFVEGTIFCHSL